MFEGKQYYTRDFKIFWLQAKVLEIRNDFAGKLGGDRVLTIKMVKWDLPSLGWFVLNTDGCIKGLSNRDGAGGLIRDEHCSWVRGFTVNLGSCRVDEVELCAIWHGLKVAWDLNISKLEVRLDSKHVACWLLSDVVLNSHVQNLLLATRELVSHN